MPELPEVETVRRSLDSTIRGKTISDIEVRYHNSFVAITPHLIGKRIVSTGRKGKVLHLYLDDRSVLNIHLKMSGQILYAPDRTNAQFLSPIPFAGTNIMPGRSTRVIFYLESKEALYFNDSRKFGWIKHTPEPLGPKGVDVTSRDFTPRMLVQALSKSSRPVKTLLLDQDSIAGIGNIYANDALFRAGIRPDRPADSLNPEEYTRLFYAIQETITLAIQSKGASGKDEVFITPDGSRGGYQHHFVVYQQEGLPCKTCRTPIERIVMSGRSSFLCPVCQS